MTETNKLSSTFVIAILLIIVNAIAHYGCLSSDKLDNVNFGHQSASADWPKRIISQGVTSYDDSKLEDNFRWEPPAHARIYQSYFGKSSSLLAQNSTIRSKRSSSSPSSTLSDDIDLEKNADTDADVVLIERSARDLTHQQSSGGGPTGFRWPRSDQHYVLDAFARYFSKPRSHEDQETKQNVRESIVLKLKEYGFETSFLQRSRFEVRRRPALSYNIISILAGRKRKTKDEKIILIGAHWDSASKAPGVDDNGSGSVCLLEIARLLSKHKCQFNETIMLVWFDYEEHGKFGSEFFVNDYLFPLELDINQSKFIGAYIMDMILVRDKENYTQSLPTSVISSLPSFVDELESEKYRGDFLAAWARDTYDDPLVRAFANSWRTLGFESRTFKTMRPRLPQWSIPSHDERFKWKDFFRSDHASFWYPSLTSSAVRRAPDRHQNQNSNSNSMQNSNFSTSSVQNSGNRGHNATGHNPFASLLPSTTSGSNNAPAPAPTPSHPSLNAVLLTDLGPWRKSYAKCYHSACDDTRLLTDNNLAFMQQVIDSLVLTLGRVAGGTCPQMSLPPSNFGIATETHLDSTLTLASNLQSTSTANTQQIISSTTLSPNSAITTGDLNVPAESSLSPVTVAISTQRSLNSNLNSNNNFDSNVVLPGTLSISNESNNSTGFTNLNSNGGNGDKQSNLFISNLALELTQNINNKNKT